LQYRSARRRGQAVRRLIRHPQAIDRYLRWLRDQALPVWSDRGFDRRGGYFQERLDWQGRPLDCPRRSMVQARQIYVFAEAGSLGWFDAGLELAEQAMHSLVRDYATEAHGRIAIRYASAGPLSGMNDSYGHAFVLLAAATLYRAAPSQSLVKLADGVLAHIEDCLVDRQFGGLFDTFPVQGQDKRQNPVMHLVEALLALDLAMPGRGYLERAVTHVRLVKRHLLCPETGAICEYFARNWSIHPDPSKAGLVEPGHLFEWIWLLDQLEQRTSEHEGPTIAVSCPTRGSSMACGRHRLRSSRPIIASGRTPRR
jgi:mannose/cellobiose epimerase-like protein (N-acyl-D-glucosamine 2-epimerase family)